MYDFLSLAAALAAPRPANVVGVHVLADGHFQFFTDADLVAADWDNYDLDQVHVF